MCIISSWFQKNSDYNILVFAYIFDLVEMVYVRIGQIFHEKQNETDMLLNQNKNKMSYNIIWLSKAKQIKI